MKQTKYYTTKELIEIFPEAIPYLEEERRDCLIYIKAFKLLIKHELEKINKTKDEFTRWFKTEVLRITDGEILDKYEKRLRKLTPPRKGLITDEDIQRAKEYPFNQLIEVNKSGFALCPFHNEKKPSFYVRKNFYYCFSCGKSGDTIDFLMETEGLSFIDAVKKLN